MKTLIFLQKYFFLVAAFIFFYVASELNQNFSKPFMVISKQLDAWNLNDKMVQNFNLGFKRLGSSFLWVSTILESDIDHYKNKDLNSWMFRRFYSISSLDPLFYENYSFGGTYLSIIKDDLPGATIMFNKGLQYYGNDFHLLSDAGFHFYFEVGDYKRAYEVYSKLKNNPKITPVILSTLARLENAQGNSKEAYALLLNKYAELKDKHSFLAEKIHLHLYSLKAEIDLKCLNTINNIQVNCSKLDFDENPYLVNNGKYSAAKTWIPFKIKEKTTKKAP